MKRFHPMIKRLLHPGVWCTLLLTIISTALLVYIFANGFEKSLLAYAVYVLSAYTLVVLSLHIPGIAKGTKALLYANEHSKRYLTEIPFRVTISLYLSLGVNLAYATFKLIAGIVYSSFWFGAVAVYYIMLSVMRFLMLRHMRMKNRDIRQEYKQYRTCGCMLFALNLALTGVFYQMIHSGRSYYYPGTLIYAVAAYAFYSLNASIVGLIRFRKMHSPAISASKVIGLSAALVSMFTLQTAMFVSFGGEMEFQRIMNSATGGGICFIVFGMAVIMVVDANRKLKELRSDGHG